MSAHEVALLLGRIAFAGVLGLLALGNLLDRAGSVAYARSKEVPAPGLAVPASSLLLLAGATSIATGVAPRAGAAAVVVFLVGVTPVMHDFWAHEGEARQNEQIHFLKNVGLLGAAVLLAATTEWPYALWP